MRYTNADQSQAWPVGHLLSLVGSPAFDQLLDGAEVGLHVLGRVALELVDNAGQVGADCLLQDGLEDLTLDIVFELLTTVAPVVTE